MFITTASGAPPRPLRRGLYLHVSPLRLTLFSALLLASWLMVWYFTRPHPARSVIAPSPATTTLATSHPAPVAPWGELEITPIDLEPPEDAAQRFATIQTSIWHFKDTTSAQLAQTLHTVGFTDAQRDSLLATCVAEPADNGIVAKPDAALVLALTPSVRTALYRILSRDPRNPQAEPFRHRPDLQADWFADSGLSDEVIAVARRLVYQRGEMQAFVDVSVIMPFVKTATDSAVLFRTLCAQSALLVRLHIHRDSDLNALVAYWGRGGREREVRPLLESLSRVPGGSMVGVGQLMPQFARARIHTFPRLEGATPNGPQDCHWTSFNFWNHTPDDQFCSAAYVGKELGSSYHRIDKPTQLGDIVFLVAANGDGIHSATFVADDVVFTKNGSNMAAPWIFMKLPDLLTYYETNGAVQTIFFRKNGL